MEKINNAKELFDSIDAFEKDKKIPEGTLIKKIESALITASVKNIPAGGKDSIHCNIDKKNGTIELYSALEVVSDEFAFPFVDDDGNPLEGDDDPDAPKFDPSVQIAEMDAKKIKPDAKVGDIIRTDMSVENFGRIAAQTFKHVLRQGVREIEHEKALQGYNAEIHDIISAEVLDIKPDGSALIKVGDTKDVLPKNEQIEGETLKPGDKIRVYIVDVKETDRGPRAILSRSHPDFVRKLFELFIPEIQEGKVEVKSVAREAGKRTKISVFSSDPDIDPVGACIGPNRARINEILKEIHGEKIDVIQYSDDPEEYIKAALSPATVENVDIISEVEKKSQATVPENQLSLAIGNKGQNVRLAARLTSWKIDIRSDNGYFGENRKVL